MVSRLNKSKVLARRVCHKLGGLATRLSDGGKSKSLFGNRWFWFFAFVFCVGFPLLYSGIILYFGNFHFLPTLEGVRLFVELFGPAAFLFQVGLAVVVLYTIGYRSDQTDRQMELMRKTNDFRDYVEHRKVFFEMLDSLQSKHIKLPASQKLYELVFPDNTPVKFQPYLEGDAPVLTAWARRYNRISERMVQATRWLHVDSDKDRASVIMRQALMDLMRLCDSMGVGVHAASHYKHTRLLIPHLPADVYEELGLALNHILDFAIAREDRWAKMAQMARNNGTLKKLFSLAVE